MKFVITILIFSLTIHFLSAQNEEQLIQKAIEKHGEKFIKNKNISSVSIGVYKNDKTYTTHFGELEKGARNSPNNKTIYEIASVTKTMTGYLVAKAILEEKLKLEDDIRDYLKDDYPNLAFENNPITIQHLLTHTGSLPPFLPLEMNGVFDKFDEIVPFKVDSIESKYSKDQFLADLHEVVIANKPGTQYSYSNVGAEILGYILENIYQKSIDKLMQESFLEAYNMTNTAIHLNSEQKERLTKGYWMSNEIPSPNQKNKLWATGSGVKSTLPDLLDYIKMQLDESDAIAKESHRILYDNGNTLKLAYFWRVWQDKYGTSFNHHGGTSGMQNWLYIFPKYNLGISIITNQSGPKTPKLLSKTVKKILKDVVE
ncbi:serine hydrolase domain-containing protein [Chondrinema litorale]|uniref:serine hydrolase domain-containing protein n=1 Tax=Chondrinema litorale TaxID=2994555 RepID=UPI0025434A9A|nr:serine hydrolase domain-containing protein [Chondrinema litorale]UZR96491.1 serine hydrolase [Chondrinema litorale]